MDCSISDRHGDAVAVAADHGTPLRRERYAAIYRMVSGAEESRAAINYDAAAGAIAPYLAVAGTGVEVVFQSVAATGHPPWVIGSAAAGRERNGIRRQLQRAGNGDGGSAVDCVAGKRAEAAKGQARIVDGAGGRRC